MPHNLIYREATPGICGKLPDTAIENMMNSGVLVEDGHGIRYANLSPSSSSSSSSLPSPSSSYILHNLGRGKRAISAQDANLASETAAEHVVLTIKRENITGEEDWGEEDNARGGRKIIDGSREGIECGEGSKGRKEVRFQGTKRVIFWGGPEVGGVGIERVWDNEGKSREWEGRRMERRKRMKEDRALARFERYCKDREGRGGDGVVQERRNT
ncbi:hypothetical protein P280DRAFT_544475 [Massarina eburnea CBS 473.64]|uniref:Uncharacterized protein n=1 Tax=Massarina eburnea CBS 473.64 TaxID=1395130 RepID=A0A6A6SG89_9PLEO|nr:hypothetical protein P280DRAFT_544475 [Massarina eburnea CBS 473.64]